MAERFDLLGAQRLVWDSGLRAPEKLTMLALLNHWSKASRAPFPSTARLARMTSQCKRTVIRAVAELERSGALDVTRRVGQSSTYTLRPELAPAVEPDQCQRVTGDCESPVPESHTTGDPESPPPVTESHPKEAREVSKGRNPDPAHGSDAPLRLVSPTPKPSRKPRPSKGKPAPHPHAGALRDHYVAELKRLRQTDAVFVGSQWARAVKAFGQLADAVGADRARQVITAALGNEFCHRFQPWELVQDANKHLAQRPTGRRQGPVPRGMPEGWKPAQGNYEPEVTP